MTVAGNLHPSTMEATPIRRTRSLLLVLSTLLGLLGVAGPTAAGTTLEGTARQLLARLDTASERPRGYDRDRFPHWRNADGDGCDTHAEVLIAESVTRVDVGSPGCTLRGGEWRSVYDGVSTPKASRLDIDHVVALREAWESGARSWSKVRRQAYANDLGDPRTLRAVTLTTNRSKGDRSPDEWMPPRARSHCRYLGWWVVVKVRWRLSVDGDERAFIRDRLRACPRSRLTVTRAW